MSSSPDSDATVVRAMVHASHDDSPPKRPRLNLKRNKRKLPPQLFDEISVMEAGNNNEQRSDVPPKLLDELNIDTREKPFDRCAYFNDVFDPLETMAKRKYILRQPPHKRVRTNDRIPDFDIDEFKHKRKRKQTKQTKTKQRRKVKANTPVVLRHDNSDNTPEVLRHDNSDTEKWEWPDLCIEPEYKRPKSDSSLNLTPEKLSPSPEVNFLSKENIAQNQSLPQLDENLELPVIDDLFDGGVLQPLGSSTRNKISTSFMEAEQCESSSPPRRAIELSEISPKFQVLQNITICPPNVENKEPAEVMFTSTIQHLKEVLPHYLSFASSEELKKKISTLNDVVSKF